LWYNQTMDQESPNIPPEVKPREIGPEPKPHVDWRFILGVPVVLVLISLILYLFSPTNILAPKVEGSWFQSNTENIQFIIPRGWVVGNNVNLSLPVGFKEPSFILKKVGSACVVAVAERDDATSNSRKQISRADRIFSDWTQFDGRWWIASTTDSSKYSSSGETRQYLAGEFRVSANLRNNPFLLFMADGTAVPNDCNDDLNIILKTVEPYYEIVNLDSSSKGVLITEKVWADNRYNDVKKSYEHLVFIADGSKEKREVMSIPAGTWVKRFSVHEEKLYVPSNSYQFDEIEEETKFNSGIYVLDPFDGQIEQVPGTVGTDSYISSLYVKDETIYYLVGNSELGTCLDGYRHCATDLYSVPITGGEPTLVAHSPLGGSILGYVQDENAFYIGQGWGDAGCASASFIKIIGPKEEFVEKFSGCYGADEADRIAYQQTQDEINNIIMKAGASKISSKGILVYDNILQPATDDISSDAVFYFDKENY